MIVLRSESEIAEMRQAGRIVAEALEELKRMAKPGVTTKALDEAARGFILKRDGYPAFKGYRGFPGNICTSVNEVVVHGIPSGRKLRPGDIISIDIGVKFRDHYADAALTIAVGPVSEKAARLIDVTRLALACGIAKAMPGNRLSDISAAVQATAEAAGFSVVRAFVGHGIGSRIHEEPEIPNYGAPGSGPRLEAGMTLAIEPMVNEGTFEVEVLEDGWTAVTKDRRLSAHFEHTVVVRDGEAEILTKV